MDARVVIEHMERVPFRPFTIEFENGRRCTVRHPEIILFWPNRIRFEHVQACDEDQDRSVCFEPVAVAAVLKERDPSRGPGA